MATILSSIVDSSLQAHSHDHAEQDVSEARVSDVDWESDAEDLQIPQAPGTSTATAIHEDSHSALDVHSSASSASPFDLPAFLSAPSTRIRRRSELAFSRPPLKFAIHDSPVSNSYDSSSGFGLNNVDSRAAGGQRLYELADITPPAVEKLNYVGEEDLELGEDGLNTPAEFSASTTPRAPSLTYEPGYDEGGSGPSAAQKRRFKKYARIHMAAMCWCFYLEGWNDGTTGPLLPRIQEFYNIGFVIVSMIFVVNCVGFVAGATANVWLSDKLGFGKVMLLGAVCQGITYAMQIPEGPFFVRVIAYGIAGFGIAIQNAGANGLVGCLKTNTAKKLGILHGSYGIGAFSSPFAATYFSTSANHWSYHFLISLGLAVSNIVVLAVVFRGRGQDEIMLEEGEEPGPESQFQPHQAQAQVQAGQTVSVQAQAGPVNESKIGQIFRSKIVHYMALWSIIYIGVEVTMGGWIVTFIIRERQGGPSAGYISSGYFGGITAGRLFLVWINQKIGERRALFIYSFICIALEATVWAVPSLIENAVAVSLIGILMGPMYPILVNYAKDVLPRWLLTGALGWIVGIGQAGSAALPFITGLLAAKYGIGSLQPLLLSMMVVMVGVWALIPKAQRRVD